MEIKKNVIISNLNDLDYDTDTTEILIDFRNNDRKLFLDTTEETDDGTWPTVNKWTNFIKKFNDDENGNDTLVDFYFGKTKTESNWGNFTLIKDKEQGPDFQRVKLIFNIPVKFIFGVIGFGNNKEYVTKEIKEFYCNFTYEGYTFASDSKKLQTKYVNGLEIFLTDIVLIK